MTIKNEAILKAESILTQAHDLIEELTILYERLIDDHGQEERFAKITAYARRIIENTAIVKDKIESLK